MTVELEVLGKNFGAGNHLKEKCIFQIGKNIEEEGKREGNTSRLFVVFLSQTQ